LLEDSCFYSSVSSGADSNPEVHVIPQFILPYEHKS